MLKYKSYLSPEWDEVTKQLRSRCLKQNITCDKMPKQCKDKMDNLTKKYKTTKDKLRSTGFGTGGEPADEGENANADDNVHSNPKEMILQHFHDMDEILGVRESVNQQHVLESSDIALDQVNIEKDAVDNKIFEASKKAQAGESLGKSTPITPQSANYDSDDDLAFSLFFKPKKQGGVKKNRWTKIYEEQWQKQER